MGILETERLVIRELTLNDAPFILELINEPAYHRYIGDKGVRDVAAAEKYLRDGPLATYAKYGFGLWLVTRKTDGASLGMCGVIKRDGLDHPDLGFALLARHGGQGYGFEAASVVVDHARNVLRIGPLLAITAPENPPSIRLLSKLGFHFQKMIALPGYPTSSRLFRCDP